MTTKVDVREVMLENLQSMLTIVSEMARTNVVNYPLKPHVLRKWCDMLYASHDSMRKLVDKSYTREE